MQIHITKIRAYLRNEHDYSSVCDAMDDLLYDRTATIGKYTMAMEHGSDIVVLTYLTIRASRD